MAIRRRQDRGGRMDEEGQVRTHPRNGLGDASYLYRRKPSDGEGRLRLALQALRSHAVIRRRRNCRPQDETRVVERPRPDPAMVIQEGKEEPVPIF